MKTGSQKTAVAQTGRQPPLWQQLQYAAQVVHAVVQQGHSAPAALEAVPAALRAGVQALSYQTLRRWGIARWLRGQMVPKAPPAQVDALLCVALALAWRDASPYQGEQEEQGQDHVAESAGPPFGDAQAPQAIAKGTADAASDQALAYDAFTLVNQAVEAARRHPRMRHHSGLVNACLRNFLRAQPQWQTRCRQASPEHDPVLLNLPAWWLQRLRADYPHDFAHIAQAGQRQPAMHLRVNARHGTAAQYLQKHLLPAGLHGRVHGRYGIWLDQPCAVQRLPGFAQGLVSVQDAAAQLAAPLLLQALQRRLPQPTWRLLDACAAPGGKTAHLLELGDHAVTALDIDAARCARITDTLQRLRVNARVCTADAGHPAQWWDGQPFDGILLDAPCSASGIVRRHPDIAWLRREQDIAQLVQTQRQLLDALWPLLRPGGVLLYCTCSVFKAEGEEQIQAFLARHSDAERLPACGHLLPRSLGEKSALVQNTFLHADGTACADEGGQREPLHDHDGFYYALLARTGTANAG